ncbi:hypothetical protein D3C86_1283920 [compost metagenome]
MVAVVPHPADRITREAGHRAQGPDEADEADGLEALVGQVAVQVEGHAEAQPQVHAEHEGQIAELEGLGQGREAQQLGRAEEKDHPGVDAGRLEHPAHVHVRKRPAALLVATMDVASDAPVEATVDQAHSSSPLESGMAFMLSRFCRIRQEMSVTNTSWSFTLRSKFRAIAHLATLAGT